MMEQYLLLGAIGVIVVLMFPCLYRSIVGPKVTDRVIAINLLGSMTLLVIAIVSVLLDESYLLDICIIYAMLSFLAVVVFTRIFLGRYYRDQELKKNPPKSRRKSKTKDDAVNPTAGEV